jgi:hypothetical protein
MAPRVPPLAGSVSYTPNRAGVAAMMVGPEIRGALVAEAEFAKSLAEVFASLYAKTGHYASSFEVRDGGVVRLMGHLRARALLLNTARYAAVEEFGRKGHQGHRILGRTLDALSARK